MVISGAAMDGKLFRTLCRCNDVTAGMDSSEVVRVVEWKAFLLVAECIMQ